MKRTYHPSKPPRQPICPAEHRRTGLSVSSDHLGDFPGQKQTAVPMPTIWEPVWQTAMPVKKKTGLLSMNCFWIWDPSISANGLRPAQTKSFCSDGWPVIPPIFPRYWVQVSSIPTPVINGQIIAADPWEGDASYNYEESEWYQQALAANGSFIFTDAYTDAVTGKQIITLARELDTDGDVLAFDILLENFHSKKSQSDLPAGSSYYLFDPNGSLLYMFSHLDLSDSDSQVYVKQLFQEVSGGGLDNYASTIRGLDWPEPGRLLCHHGQRMVFGNYHACGSHFVCNSIIPPWWILGVLAFVLVAIVVAITIRTTISDRKARHANDTLQVLGRILITPSTGSTACRKPMNPSNLLRMSGLSWERPEAIAI